MSIDLMNKMTKRERFAEKDAHRLYFSINAQSPQWAFLCRKNRTLVRKGVSYWNFICLI